MGVAEYDGVVYSPDPSRADCGLPKLSSFMLHCERELGTTFSDYWEFDAFAAREYRTFWREFLRWSGIAHKGDDTLVCDTGSVETARFFGDVCLNYTHALLNNADALPAITQFRADGSTVRLTRGELRHNVGKLARALLVHKVKAGDRVVAIGRNNIEVVTAALAAAQIGAVFSSCSHDMGVASVIDRFSQLEPVLLLANIRTESWDQGEPLSSRVEQVIESLPSLRAVVLLDSECALNARSTVTVERFDDILSHGEVYTNFHDHNFNHPLFIMFSSGTTGVPKCIMHGAGGTLLEHTKEHLLHGDMSNRDRLYFLTNAGWMMWNWQLSALAVEAEIVVYDGPSQSPFEFWRMVSELQITVLGVNPAYLQLCVTSTFQPNEHHRFPHLRSVLSTGSILFPHLFDWVAESVKRVPIQSISGGTDIIGCFVLGNPLLAVHRGQAQCRTLGLDVRKFGDETVGELVCVNPFPSRPLGFVEDRSARYHESYFSQNPGVWTHGDLIEATEQGGFIIHGRSDGILNIRGIRIGPSEIYRILRDVEEIRETMAVAREVASEPGGFRLYLIVVLQEGYDLSTELKYRIRSILTSRGSAAMSPAEIIAVNELPVTFNGKLSEAAARDAVNGRAAQNIGALRNPAIIDEIRQQTATIDNRLATEYGDDWLRKMCEQALHVEITDPVQPFQNLGADSLSVMDLYMRVTKRTTVPFETLSQARTLEDLRAAVAGRFKPSRQKSESEIRPIADHEIDEACVLLSKGFTHMQPELWHELFNYSWIDTKPDRGWVMTNNDRIVGFLGTVYSQRLINGHDNLLCNLTSWYIDPAFRGSGPEMLGRATSNAAITYTALTPDTIPQSMFAAIGFKPLEPVNLAMPPFVNADTLVHGHLRILEGEDAKAVLDDAERKVFEDHARYDCLSFVLVDQDQHALVIARRRMIKRELPIRFPVSKIVFCTNASLVERHLERVKLFALRRHRAFALVSNKFRLPTARGYTFQGTALFRSQTVNPADVDLAYSELIILPV